MKHLVPPEQPSESILVGCLLAASGGLQDAYTYNVRDQVFANAQTGNMVLVGQSLALGQWAVAAEHLIPVVAFATGVFAAEAVRNRFHSHSLAFHWRQAVVLLEAVILLLVAFLPSQLNLLANVLVSFVCAMQVESFRKLSGNELGCLLLDYILGELTAKGRLPADPVAVRSIVSSPMADKIAAKYGVKMRSVLTGFKYIGGEILALEQKGEENRFVFGFEESCGYLKGSYARDKDAVVASMLTADLAAKLKREGMNLADQIDALYAELGYHDAKVISIELKGPNAMELSAKFMKDFRAEIPTELGGVRVTSCTDYLSRVRTELATGATEPVLLPKSNVVALELGESGSVIVRPSGTEPKVKLYLTAVDRDPKRAAALLERLAEDMKRLAGC